MSSISVVTLRRVLWLDAISGLLMACAHVFFNDLLTQLLGVPERWLLLTAPVLFGTFVLAGALGSRARPPLVGVDMLVLGNALWVLASVAVCWSGVWPLTGLGSAWVLLQALVVVAMATLEWRGARGLRAISTASA